MGAPKKGYHVAPVIRKALLGALGVKMRRDGVTLNEIVLAEMDTHGVIEVMNKLGKYIERSGENVIRGTVEHKHVGSIEHVGVSELDSLIGEASGGKAKGGVQDTRPH